MKKIKTESVIGTLLKVYRTSKMLGNDHARVCFETTHHETFITQLFSRMTIQQFKLLTLNHLTNTTDLFPEWLVFTNVITQNIFKDDNSTI